MQVLNIFAPAVVEIESIFTASLKELGIFIKWSTFYYKPLIS